MGFPTKGPADYYAPGDYNAVCSLCGTKYKASQLLRHWQGLYRCDRCWEIRHPQDFVRGVQDIQKVPWDQPPKSFYIQICTFNGQSAIAGWAIAGCMIAGNKLISLDMTIPAGG
jgi:hypothetical protein